MPWSILGDRCLVIDLETTGFSPTNDEIIEVGVVEIRSGEIVGLWGSLIRTETPIHPAAIQVHGITNDMLMGAPSRAKVKRELKQRLAGEILIEHNTNGFDTSFLRSFLGSQIWKHQLNTLHLARRLVPECGGFDLATLCAFSFIDLDHHHSAQADALATAELFLYLLKKAEESCACREELISLLGVKG